MCIYIYIYMCVYSRYYFLRYVSWKGVVFSFHWGTPFISPVIQGTPAQKPKAMLQHFPATPSHLPRLDDSILKEVNFYWFHCFNKECLEFGGASLPGTILEVQLHISQLKLERSIQRKPASIDAWTRTKIASEGTWEFPAQICRGLGSADSGMLLWHCQGNTSNCRDATTRVDNLHFVANIWPFQKNSLDLQISQRVGAFSSQKSESIKLRECHAQIIADYPTSWTWAVHFNELRNFTLNYGIEFDEPWGQVSHWVPA